MSHFMGALLMRATERLRGANALATLRDIEANPGLSREQAEQLQLRLLRRMLEHAERHVPYYRDLFRSLGLRAADVRSLRDFAHLPVLTKDIVREQVDTLVREDVPRDQLLAHHSGGSTGVPLTFYRDSDYVDASSAGGWRNMLRAGWRPGEMVAFFWGADDRLKNMPRLEFELRQRLRRFYQFDPFDSGPAAFDRWLRRWARLRPSVAHGYASTIARFAMHIEDRGARVPALKGVFTTAERLYPAQREVIARVFQCRVFDCYGSSEVQNIAAECARGRMHVNSDFVVLETADEEVDSDGSAPLILTSLRNFAMPFLRYRNEDRGRILRSDCDCGCGFPLMDLRVARTSDNFVLPDGRVVHGEFFTHLLYGARGVETFQFHQTEPGRIALLIVRGRGGESELAESLTNVRAQLRKLSPDLRVDIREVDSIPRSRAGKHRFTRSDVAAAAAAGA